MCKGLFKEYLLFCILFLLIFPITISAENNTDAETIETLQLGIENQRIRILELELENKLYEKKAEISEEIKRAVEKETVNIEKLLLNKFDTLENENMNSNLFNKKLITFFGVFGAITIIGGIINIRQYTEKKIRKRFDLILDGKGAIVEELIAKYDKEAILKEKKRILLIDDNEDKLYLFLKKLGFKSIAKDSSTHIDKKTIQNYDLLLFNNELGEEGFKIYNDLLNEKASMKTVCFYFGEGSIPGISPGEDRFASANIKSKLYGNLLTALKFQDDYLSNKKRKS